MCKDSQFTYREIFMPITREDFKNNAFGEKTELFDLTNAGGLRIRIMTHGATILSIETPDRDGRLDDIVLGHDTAAEYADGGPYFGAAIGRFGNRIKAGRFTLDGKEYRLEANNGPNALHGGLRGFDKVIWDAEILEGENAVRMTYVSADGEEGFPGKVKTIITYTLTDANELKIDYAAETTKATPINLTNHSYFNLAGHKSGSALGQLMIINADTFLPTDETAIPYGEASAVEGTPFDFRTPHVIGERIDDDNEQLRFGAGYDHTFCLNQAKEGELSFCARAEDPASGRVLETFTTEPGVQFYTGNYLGGLKGKDGCMYVRRAGFCLETQHYPDSPNQPQFPNTILRPGETFTSQTVYRFSVR
jgi:aldose 1-epimerase